MKCIDYTRDDADARCGPGKNTGETSGAEGEKEKIPTRKNSLLTNRTNAVIMPINSKGAVAKATVPFCVFTTKHENAMKEKSNAEILFQ